MTNFFKRFSYAFQGLRFLILGDKNIQFHLVLFFILLIFGFYFQISRNEWFAVLICSALVMCLEGINTLFEKIADYVQPDIHPEIKIIKDAAAGVVLLASIFALVIAGIIFIPKIYKLLIA